MKMRKYVLLLIAVCAVSFLLAGCGTKSVDVSQYVTVTFKGLDGKGEANLSYDGLESAVKDAVLTGKESILEAEEKVYLVCKNVDFELDKEDGLSNGDKVTVNITASNEAVKNDGIKFIGTDPIEFTVSGLKEVTKVDPFDAAKFNVTSGEGVYVEFTGTSPRASVQIRNTLPESDPLSSVEYTLDKEYSYDAEFKKGQEVKITASAPYSWEDEGFELTETSTTVKVGNVDEYITKYEDIDDATLDKIAAQCSDIVKAKIIGKGNAPQYNDEANSLNYITSSRVDKYENPNFANAYFLSLKDGLDSYFAFDCPLKENGLYLTFTIDMKGVKKNYIGNDKVDVTNAIGYLYVSNIVKNKDGEINFSIDMVKLGSKLYAGEDVFKSEVINQYLDSFTLTEQGFSKKLSQ